MDVALSFHHEQGFPMTVACAVCTDHHVHDDGWYAFNAVARHELAHWSLPWLKELDIRWLEPRLLPVCEHRRVVRAVFELLLSHEDEIVMCLLQVLELVLLAVAEDVFQDAGSTPAKTDAFAELDVLEGGVFVVVATDLDFEGGVHARMV